MLLHPARDAKAAALFLHQAVFLHSALMRRATLAADHAARMLTRSVLTSAADGPRRDDDDDDDGGYGADDSPLLRAVGARSALRGLGPQLAYSAWSTRPLPCRHCELAVPRRLVCSTARVDSSRSAQLGAEPLGLRLATAEDVPAGVTLAAVWADQLPATWCVPGEGWLAKPRATRIV